MSKTMKWLEVIELRTVYKDINKLKIELEKLLNKKVDLVSSNGLSKYIKPIVDTEKQLIYAR